MISSSNPIILGDELMELVRSRLAAGQKVRYLPFVGVSMLPMLRMGKDAVELAPLPEKLQKYDLPVYQYPSGKYVMHRVVEVREDHYICLGDNTYEPGVTKRLVCVSACSVVSQLFATPCIALFLFDFTQTSIKASITLFCVTSMKM